MVSKEAKKWLSKDLFNNENTWIIVYVMSGPESQKLYFIRHIANT